MNMSKLQLEEDFAAATAAGRQIGHNSPLSLISQPNLVNSMFGDHWNMLHTKAEFVSVLSSCETAAS